MKNKKFGLNYTDLSFAFHTGLRKATNSNQATLLWHLIHIESFDTCYNKILNVLWEKLDNIKGAKIGSEDFYLQMNKIFEEIIEEFETDKIHESMVFKLLLQELKKNKDLEGVYRFMFG